MANPELTQFTPELYYPIFDLHDDEKKHWSSLQEACSYMNEEETLRLNRAVVLMKYAHQNQERDSGERYSNHCLRVGGILAEQRLEANTVVAGILHDVLEDSGNNGFPVSSEFIARVFGTDVEKLVLGCRNSEWDVVLKPEDITGYQTMSEKQLADALKEEYDRRTVLKNFRQFSGEVQCDPRVILIKLADRLDNMRTIFGKGSKLKQQKKAVEALEVSANLAKIIGDEETRRELSDLAMEVIDGRMFYYLTDVVLRTSGSNDRPDPKDYHRYELIMKAVAAYHQPDRLREEVSGLLPQDLGILPGKININFPGIYAMYQTWMEKENKSSRFDSSDIYAKVSIPLAAERLRYGNDISFYENRIKSEIEAKGWRILTGYGNLERKQAAEKQKTFFCQSPEGKTVKFKLVSDEENNGNRFRLSGFYDGERITPSMINQLAKLAGDYQIIAQGDAESRQKVRSFIREMGGIRVQGTKPGEFTLLRNGATLLEYAYKVRGRMLGRLTGFRINDGEMRPVRDAGMVLQNDWKIQLFFSENLQSHMNVTPEWLRNQADPDVLEVLADILEKRLRDFQSQKGLSTYERENRAIMEIGSAKLDRMLIHQGRYAGAEVADDYIRELGFSDTGDFLKAMAYGQIRYFDVLVIAEVLDRFSQETVAVEIDFSPDHPVHQRFAVICDKLGQRSGLLLMHKEEREILGERSYVRYYFPITQKKELLELILEMENVYYKRENSFLLEKTSLIADHITTESPYYSEVGNLLEEFRERKEIYLREEIDVIRAKPGGRKMPGKRHGKLSKYERRRLWEQMSKARKKKWKKHGPKRR